MNEKKRCYLSNILQLFKKNEISASKVLLHKFVYFLNTQGIGTGFRFEPYTYGPYSFDLASTLSRMVFWDEISEEGAEIHILNLEQSSSLDSSQVHEIENQWAIFCTILDNDFSFGKLECIGTTLYCAEVIADHGDIPAEENIMAEFKLWKKQRYSDEQIRTAYTKLKEYLPRPRTIAQS